MPRKREICSICGRNNAVVTRGRSREPICGNCHRKNNKMICSRCGVEKPVHVHDGGCPLCATCYSNAHRKICSICGQERQINVRTSDGKPICGNCATYASPSRMFKKYQQSAHKRNLTFSLSEQDFMSLVSSECDYCGERSGKYNGVDRVDNNLGYEKDNCVPCCTPCNLMKRDMGHDRFLERCRLVTLRSRLRVTASQLLPICAVHLPIEKQIAS